MRKQVIGLLAIAALPAIATAAQYHHAPATACLVDYSPDQNVGRGSILVNWDSYGKNFSCPFEITGTSSNPITVDPASWRVDYGDLRADDGVSCRPVIVTSTGTTIFGPWRYSCGTPGGCTSPTYPFTGSGNLTFPDTIASTASVVAVSMQCYVPGWDGVQGTSSLSGVAVGTATP